MDGIGMDSNRRMDMDGWKWTDGRRDGRTDEWTDTCGKMDGQIGRKVGK